MYAFEFKTKCSSCGKVAITQNQNWKCQFCNKLNRLNFKELDETKLALDDGKPIEYEPATPTDQPIQVPSVKLPYWVEPKTLTYIFVTISSVFLLFYIMLIPNDTETIMALIPYLIGIVAIVIVTGILYNNHLTRSIGESKRIINNHYKKHIAVFVVLLLILILIPTSNSQVVITNAETSNARSIEASDDTTVNNSFARGGSRNIVRGIDNNFYYFWHNTTDVWCSVITKNGVDMSAGTPMKLVGINGIILKVVGVVHGMAVAINQSRTEIYLTWSVFNPISRFKLHFSKCTDLSNIDQATSWKAINDSVGYNNISTSQTTIYNGLSIALNGSSIPHIVWHECNGYRYINYTTVKSNAWQTPICITQNNSNYGRLWNPIIDINRTDVAHIFWGNTSSATDTGWVNHTYCDTTANDPMVLTNWNLEAGPILENINTTGFSQAIDKDNDIWLAGVNKTNDLQINILNGTTWLNGTGENISFPHTVENISLGADANGTIYLGYTDETNDDIRYATSKDWFSTNTKIADYGTYAGITIEKRSKYDKWSLGLGWVNGSNFEEVHFENLTVVYNDVWWKYSAYSGKETSQAPEYDIAVYENYIHLVFSDKRINNANYHIYYRQSEDYGQTWSGDCLLSEYNISCNAKYPSIAVNGTNLHVVYISNSISIVTDNRTVYINSTDNGKTWSAKKTIDTSVETDPPDIAVTNDGRIHIVYTETDNVTYSNSTDDGITFSTPKIVLNSGIGTNTYYEDPILAINDSYLALVAEWINSTPLPDYHQVHFTNSSDNGTTWSTYTRLGDNNVYNGIRNPDIAINKSNIYVTYYFTPNTGNDQILFNKSSDLGVTWLTNDKSLYLTPYSCNWPSIMVNSTSIDVIYYTETTPDSTISYTTSTDGGNTWGSRQILIQNTSTRYPKIMRARAVDSLTRNLAWTDWNGLNDPNSISYLRVLRGLGTNHVPQFIDTPSDPDYAYVDEYYSFDVNATDPDSDPITYAIQTNTTFLSMNSTSGLLNGTPTASDTGTFFVNISINDTFTEIYYNFTFIVKDGHLNITNPLSNLNWYDDMWRQHWYQASNISGNYNWTLVTNATQTNCSNTINNQSGYMRLIPNGPGYSWWFNITITDSSESDYNNFTLTCIKSPPYPGDWDVIENQTKSNETLPLRGNLTVYDGKTLTLENTTVEINCTSDAEFYILVWGNLLWNNTTITINYTTYFYNFTIASNGSATITNSTIEFVYDGIRIQSNNVAINNSIIRFNYGDGFIIENSAPTITNNTIHSHTENGISVENATPRIAYNTIQYNEWSGIAINYSIVSGLSHNTISYNKVGIYTFNSTLTSDNNTIKRSRSIGIVVEINSTYIGKTEIFINNLVQLTVHNLSTAQLTDSGFSSGSTFTQPSFEFVVEGTLTIISTSISTYKNNIFYLYNGSVIVRNCSIATSNVYTAKLEWNSTVTLVNTTILDNYDFADSTNSTVIVQYYLHVYVFDNHGGVDNATINITQRNGTRVMTNGLTNRTGWYKNIILTEYITNASTKIFHTPHIIVVKNGTKLKNRSLVMDHTQILIIDFSSRLTFNLLKNKWNLIGISKDLSVTYTARDLIDLGCSSVTYRDSNGVYKSYFIDGSKYYGEDFTIQAYKSYFVFYTKSTPLTLSGSETRGAVTISLQKGYNMVAVPHSGITALDVIQEVEGAKSVVVRRNGVYKSFNIASNPSSSFSLNENEGIYIFVEKQTTWVIS